jgi:hypothetical protein
MLRELTIYCLRVCLHISFTQFDSYMKTSRICAICKIIFQAHCVGWLLGRYILAQSICIILSQKVTCIEGNCQNFYLKSIVCPFYSYLTNTLNMTFINESFKNPNFHAFRQAHFKGSAAIAIS